MGNFLLNGRWMGRSLAEAHCMSSRWAMEERVLPNELQMDHGWAGGPLALFNGRFTVAGFYFCSTLKGKNSLNLGQRTY